MSGALFFYGMCEMRQEQLIAKIIDLEERANVHTAEYQRLLHVPKSRTEASKHHRKAIRLQSKIHDLIREIALCECVPIFRPFPKISTPIHHAFLDTCLPRPYEKFLLWPGGKENKINGKF